MQRDQLRKLTYQKPQAEDAKETDEPPERFPEIVAHEQALDHVATFFPRMSRNFRRFSLLDSAGSVLSLLNPCLYVVPRQISRGLSLDVLTLHLLVVSAALLVVEVCPSIQPLFFATVCPLGREGLDQATPLEPQ